MELASIEESRAPPGAAVDTLTTPDGIEIRHARWRSRKLPFKGTVLLLQGRTEYIEKYFETAGDLLAAGYDVCTFDWRGQGASGRLLGDPRRGYVDSFDQHLLDLETVLQQVVLPDCRPPYSILAHSTGSLIALLGAPDIANRIQRMFLCSPLIRFGSVPVSQVWLKRMSGALSVLGLGQIYMAGGPDLLATRRFAENPLTSDTRRFERNQAFSQAHPELTIGGPTAAWVYAACRAMDRVTDPDFIGSIHIPTVLVTGSRDVVVSNRAAEHMGYVMRSGRTVTIDGALHEILQERDVFRQQLLAAFMAFFPGSSGA